jgi:hypothetical protein
LRKRRRSEKQGSSNDKGFLQHYDPPERYLWNITSPAGPRSIATNAREASEFGVRIRPANVSVATETDKLALRHYAADPTVFAFDQQIDCGVGDDI